MMKKLSGWDLLTWRLGFEDKGIVPLVGAQITVRGHVNFEDLLSAVERAIYEIEVLRVSLSKEAFPTLTLLGDFDVKECIQVLHNHVHPSELALRTATSAFSLTQYRSDLPLWRVFVVYQEHHTLLFPFLHHAIADGHRALEIILRLCGESLQIQTTKKTNPTENVGEILTGVLTNPLSFLQKTAPALLGLNSLAALTPKHTLPEKAERSFRDEVIQFALSRESLRQKAHELSVSTHDLSVAFMLQTIQALDEGNDKKNSAPIRVNVPVGSPMTDAFNQYQIARIFVPRSTFADSAQTYRSNFQKWREHPALNVYEMAFQAISQVEHIDLTSFATNSDVTVSSLPPIRIALSLAGCEVEQVWPLVPSMGSAFNLTSISLNSIHFFTLTYDVGIKLTVAEVRNAIRHIAEENFGVAPNFQQQL